MALFVLLSSIGVKAHTMYCHDNASTSLFVSPDTCCDVSQKIVEEEGFNAVSCCLVVSEDFVYEYENPVPDIQWTDFSVVALWQASSYITVPQFIPVPVQIEEQNLPPPLYRSPQRAVIQVYII